MGRFKSVGVNQSEINAELRARYGDTVTRQQILAYRVQTGIDPRWIRKNPECSIGRGLYRIPESGAATSSVAKEARRERVKDEVRPVIPTPFDGDEARPVIPTPFDEQTESEPADYTPRKTRRNTEDPYANREMDENGEIPRPVFIHAWICDNAKEGCPGRKPGEYAPENGQAFCECGSQMHRHAWAKKQRLF